MRSFAMSIEYSGNVVSKDVLKSFRNLLQGGDGTSGKKLDEDLDILWASKGGNVDLSKWSKDYFSTGLIPDYIDCKYFAGKPMATNNFGLCFTAKEKSCGNGGGEKRKMEVGVEENQGKGSAQKLAIKSSFIHTVSSNYQCIYSIPSGVPIVFKNNRAHTN